MNILEKFIRSKSKTNIGFAEMVGKNRQTIEAQIKIDRIGGENYSTSHLLDYMKILKVKKFSGIYDGDEWEIKKIEKKY